jgi:hypothetical protein
MAVKSFAAGSHQFSENVATFLKHLENAVARFSRFAGAPIEQVEGRQEIKQQLTRKRFL